MVRTHPSTSLGPLIPNRARTAAPSTTPTTHRPRPVTHHHTRHSSPITYHPSPTTHLQSATSRTYHPPPSTHHRTHHPSSTPTPVSALTTPDSQSRPFGVALLIAGWDHEAGPVLYHTDPSGTYVKYRCMAIGSGSEGALTALQVRGPPAGKRYGLNDSTCNRSSGGRWRWRYRVL